MLRLGKPRIVVRVSALPFRGYEDGGRRLLGRPSAGDGSSRRGYGVPVFEQCGALCVYCGLGGSYEGWLNLSVDHVVPRGDGKKLGYPVEWIEAITNLVTCCRACNEFLNGYRVKEQPPETLDGFYDLRDSPSRPALARFARDSRRNGWHRAEPLAGDYLFAGHNDRLDPVER